MGTVETSNDKFRILFVDDEQAILDGLRNILRRHKLRWDMQFALGGEEALAALRQSHFDVLVTDMRMPGMNGVQLLEQVRGQYPDTVRLVLSGYADRATVIAGMPVVHQYLTKPCDIATLRDAIERITTLAPLLTNTSLRQLVGGLDRLPSVPQVYWDLRRAANDPRTELSEIADIVETDPAIVTKVLQLVNSAYFGIGQAVTTVRHAVRLLGIEMLTALVLTAGIFDAQNLEPRQAARVIAIQKRSIGVAQKAIEVGEPPLQPEELFTAGLIHDVGEIVLALSDTPFETIAREAEQRQVPRHVIEAELFGVTHAEIGAYLLGVWGLPAMMVEAAAYHLRPECAPAMSAPLVRALAEANDAYDAAEADAQSRRS